MKNYTFYVVGFFFKFLFMLCSHGYHFAVAYVREDKSEYFLGYCKMKSTREGRKKKYSGVLNCISEGSKW